MELILKSNNEQSIAKIIALAKKLDIAVEEKAIKTAQEAKEEVKSRILNFKANSPSSFGNIDDWQRETREDRNLPFS